MKMRTPTFAAIALAALALAACGGDDDEKGDGAKDDAQVAEQIETYLQQNAKNPDVSHVQASGDQVRVITGMNAGLPDDHTRAKELCRVVKASGAAEGKSTTIVDGGDVDIEKCPS